MIIRAGFQIIQFQRSFELPKPLRFVSHEEALKWLKQLGFLDSQVRECLRDFSDDPESFRLTDHEAAERMAALLYSGKVVAVARQQGLGSAAPAPKAPVVAAAFPLSERVQRTPTASSPKPAPAEDPPTFNPKLDSVIQAAALVAAAEQGKPFCPQCAKLKTAVTAGIS